MVGPHGRLGVAWAAVTMAAAVGGPLWLAAWLALASGLAGAQVARSRRRVRSQVAVVVGGLGAMAVTATAAAGPWAAAVTTAALLTVALAGALSPGWRRTGVPVAAAAAAVLGLAAAAPVLLRAETGLVPVLVLLAFAMAYDAGNYLVGSGASSAWEGPAAGMAAVGTLTLVVAAVLVPPFRGVTPWVLGGLAAVLAPLGPIVGTALQGRHQGRVPALRRLDSLILLGPLWSLAAVLLLD